MTKILVIGAGGQLGTELCHALAAIHGYDHIITSDINPEAGNMLEGFTFRPLDATNSNALEAIIREFGINQIYHLAAILSAKGEENPMWAWDLNMGTLFNVLEAARIHKIEKVYWPSSIAVFGPQTPKSNTPQFGEKDPTTVYGISKLAGERWREYYWLKYGVDVRSLRYPGLIGYKSLPGGGTTDYAVDIFHKALKGAHFECFLGEYSALPMMYMPDAIKATLDLMHAPAEKIKVRGSYNVSAMSFTPAEIAAAIHAEGISFPITYKPDFRQTIADSWPDAIDDSQAREDWGWAPQYDLKAMVKDIIKHLPAEMKKMKSTEL